MKWQSDQESPVELTAQFADGIRNEKSEIEKEEKHMKAEPKDIVTEYLAVLKQREKYGMAMPLSMLSHTKTEIRDAIKAVIAKTEDDEERNKLQKGYVTLAEFIPDEILKRVTQDWKDVADAECEPGTESSASGQTDIMAEVVKVQKEIADEGALLSQEIEEFVRKI